MTYPRTSPRIHSCSSGSSDLVSGPLEAPCPERVDSTGSEYGVQASLGSACSPPHAVPHSLPRSSFKGGRGDSGSGNPSSLGEGSGGTSFPLSGVLRQNLCRTQGQRGFSPSSGSVCSQQILGTETLSDGDPGLYQGFHPQRRLGDDSRPERRLFPCFHPSEGQEIPQIFVERESLPVQGSPIWPLPSTLGIHEGNAGAGDLLEVKGDQSTHVLRRLAHISSVVPPVQGSHSTSGGHSERSRVLPSLGKVISRPIPGVCVSGHVLQHQDLQSVPDGGSHSSLHLTERLPTPSRSGVCSPSTLSSGPDGVDGSSPSPWSPTQERVPETTQWPLESVSRFLGCLDPSSGLDSSGPYPVDERQLASVGSLHFSAFSGCRAVHRRLLSGVGSPCGSSDGSGHLAARGQETTHKCSRIRSSHSCSPGLFLFPAGEGGSPLHGQHHCSGVCEQARWHQSSLPVQENRVPPPAMSRPEFPASGAACSRQAEHHCRFPQQASLCTPHGVDSCKEGAPAGVADLAQTYGGPFCNEVQQHFGPLRFPSPGPGGLGSGRPLYPLEGVSGLRLSPDSHPWQGDQEGQTGPSVSDPDLSLLASSTLVSRPASTDTCSSSGSSGKQESTGSTEVRHSSRKPVDPQPTRMASVRGNLRALGASNKVIELVALAHRPGTQSVYSYHWERWLKWCEDQAISPLSPSNMDLANFLGVLASEGKATATIRVYRSAICTTLRQLGGPVFQDDYLIRDTLKGSALLEARSPRRAPAWDLNLVLSFLKGPQFEPLHSLDLRALTLKTTFLLALASGRRVSGVNHFSGLPKDVGLSPEGSFVLKFLPEFLAKNQAPGTLASPLTIPPLVDMASVQPSDVTLCPVRALKRYREVTRSMRGDRRKLLLSFNTSYHKDISVATISRWIRQVIIEAYAAEGKALGSPRAHEVRAWAASLALAHSVSLIDILQAAFWESSNTFIRCYLRDVSVEKEDGLSSLSCVAAQSSLPPAI